MVGNQCSNFFFFLFVNNANWISNLSKQNLAIEVANTKNQGSHVGVVISGTLGNYKLQFFDKKEISLIDCWKSSNMIWLSLPQWQMLQIKVDVALEWMKTKNPQVHKEIYKQGTN